MAHCGEGALDRIGGPYLLPVFGREVIERQQHLAVFDLLGNGLLVFHAVDFNEETEGGIRCGLRFSLPNIMKMTLGFGLHRLWHRVQHVAGLVEPAPLLTS